METGMIPYFCFENFSQYPAISHGFSTRIGGMSTGCYAQMNLGMQRGDLAENVRENFAIFCGMLGVSPENMVFSRQIHQDHVAVVTAQDRGNGFLRDNKFDLTCGADALITNCEEVVLTLFFADCVPIFLFDPIQNAIGLVHSGWRGTVSQIAAKTVNAMEKAFQSNPADILAGIGPSIGPCCFETKNDVYEAVTAMSSDDAYLAYVECLSDAEQMISETKMQNRQQKEEQMQESEKKYKIDLWGINKRVLQSAGVLEQHICTAGICTACDPERYFSHRKLGAKRGNLAAIIQLNKRRSSRKQITDVL